MHTCACAYLMPYLYECVSYILIAPYKPLYTITSLAVLVLVLSISTLGLSFAAAILAKDTKR